MDMIYRYDYYEKLLKFAYAINSWAIRARLVRVTHAKLEIKTRRHTARKNVREKAHEKSRKSRDIE